jgi:hypothetical protein
MLPLNLFGTLLLVVISDFDLSGPYLQAISSSRNV